jgi:hypothetical protein
MPIKLKTKRVSADEARSNIEKRSTVKSTPRGDAVMKVNKAAIGGSWDDETRSARFVMTTQQVDRYGDIVVTAGGITDNFEQNPVVLLCHDSSEWPVGSWANMEKILKGRPPRMEGDSVLLPAGGPVMEIEETAWMLANGGIRACSIGFVPDWENMEMILDEEGHWTGGFQFNAWELVECSLCPVPANPGALMKAAAGEMKLAREFIEDILDNYARTPDGLLVPRAEFEKAYKELVEKRVAVIEPEKPKPAEVAAAELIPQNDDEQKAAALRGAALEVAKLCAPFEGAVAALEGATAGKFVADGGVWKHAGDVAETDAVNYVVACSVDGETTAYALTHKCGRTPYERTADGWKAKDEVEVQITIDTAPAMKAIEETKTAAQKLMTTLRSIFGKMESEHERLEPKLDAPPALASAEEIEVVRQRSTAIRQRLAEKSLT